MLTNALSFPASSLTMADPILESFQKIKQNLENDEKALRKGGRLTAEKLLSIQTQFFLLQQKVELYITYIKASGINSEIAKIISLIKKGFSEIQTILIAWRKNLSANDQKNPPKI